MDKEITEKLLQIQDKLLTDIQYQALYKEYKALDTAFKQLVFQMDDDTQSVIWDYLGICVQMHLKMVESALDTE